MANEMLGADNKRACRDHGCDAFLIQNPADQARHIKIMFTGRGRSASASTRTTEKSRADLIHDRRRNSRPIEDEPFSADGAPSPSKASDTHPVCQGKMEHAIKIAAASSIACRKNTCRRKPPREQAGLFAYDRPFQARWRSPRSASSCAISPTRLEGKRKPSRGLVKAVHEGLCRTPAHRLEIKPTLPTT